jgi:cell division protease FtsH
MGDFMSGDNRNDNNNKNQKGGGPQWPFKMPDLKPFGGWKFTIVYILILVVGMSLFNYVFLNRVNPAIDFSEFKARIASGEIKRVEMTDSYFTGYTSARQTPALRAPIRSPYMTAVDQVYRTVPINDRDFIKLMDEKGVAY